RLAQEDRGATPADGNLDCSALASEIEIGAVKTAARIEPYSCVLATMPPPHNFVQPSRVHALFVRTDKGRDLWRLAKETTIDQIKCVCGCTMAAVENTRDPVPAVGWSQQKRPHIRYLIVLFCIIDLASRPGSIMPHGQKLSSRTRDAAAVLKYPQNI